ncbi:FAD-dependent oxidoreductase [Terasakiella pusilla]|uniref:FAD-dependent oxidoreductase n=1 Tax=Terasakiella pusilla TaxID=64973 RepID=UPI00048D25A0|nr:FAD-dependent oxidoreductase [Terasakiella pusilla]
MNTIEYVKEGEGDFAFDMPLVIIGGGACGLVAALAAADQGVECVVLERDPFPRGSTFMSSGFIPASNTRYQQACGVDDTPAIMASDIMGKNHHEADPAIVDALSQHSGPVIEWLADQHNIPFELVEGFLYPGHTRMRMHCTPRRTGEELMACLIQAVENAEIPLICDAQVETLCVGEEDRIKGVVYTRPDGQVERIGCEALLLACNGFGGNPELVERFIPAMKGGLYYGHEGNQGDALLWGEKLKAATQDLGAYQGHGSLATPHQILISWAVMMQGGIQVNQLGERFSNENNGYSEQAANVLRQPDGIAYNLFDERIHQELLKFEDYRNAFETGAVKTFETLADLAKGVDMPVDALQATFADMEKCRRGEQVDAFGRQFDTKLDLNAPYYLIKVTGALFHTQGGLDVDVQARVKKQDGSVFSNLFAAGGAARGVSGSNDSGYLSGNGLLSAVVMGQIAGSSAAKLVTA